MTNATLIIGITLLAVLFVSMMIHAPTKCVDKCLTVYPTMQKQLCESKCKDNEKQFDNHTAVRPLYKKLFVKSLYE